MIDFFATRHVQKWQNVEASFEIAHMIAKKKEANNRSCSSIQPCVWEADSKKLAKISIADSSIKICIHQLTKDIECHVLEKIHALLFCYSRW